MLTIYVGEYRIFALRIFHRLKGEAHLLLLAQDLSPRSAARLRQKLPDIPVISLPCTMQTLSRYTGKNTGILAVCDENFAGGIRAMMSDDEEDLDR